MAYKTVLVHVDQGPDAAARIGFAAQFALANDAHLIGAAVTGVAPWALAAGMGLAVPPLPVPLDQLRADAALALDAFERLAAGLGVVSLERRVLDEQAGAAISMQARYCDVVVLSQSDRQAAPVGGLRADFPEYVLLNSARPVLLAPAGLPPAPLGRHVMVGWNGSFEATRAIGSALALLQRAARVELVVLNPDEEGDVHGPLAGADMALYLARHGVKVDVRTLSGVGDCGAALLALADDGAADLLVLGAYGHSRAREILLGGATRTALASARLPLWIAR